MRGTCQVQDRPTEPALHYACANNSGDNNSYVGKFVERRADNDHNKLLPDQQTERRLMLPNV